MKIFLAEHRGFCYGVGRAIGLARQCVGRKGRFATLGPIIHNPQMVEKLAAQGIGTIRDLSELDNGTVIIRSHGVGPEVYRQAAEQGLEVVDATCPDVKKAQQAAHELRQEGYQVVVLGEKNHPEVASILAWTDNTAITVETVAEAEALGDIPRLGVVTQTTFPGPLYEAITAVLKPKTADLKIRRTTCPATDLRQRAAAELAAKVEVMVVVGGKNSANTARLAEICRQAGSRVFHIETAAELTVNWFEGVQAAGITAGASTPDWVIEEVYHKMQEIDQNLDQGLAKLENGMIVKGKVVGVREDEVFVDIGYKAEGVIPLAELAFPAPAKAGDAVKEGDIIDVLVIEADTSEGAVKLSKTKADSIVAWDKLEQALADKQPVEAKVTEAVKGGLALAVFGVRGFVPASQVDTKFVEDLTVYAGQTLSVVPIEVDRTKQRAVLSRRVILEEERRQHEEEAFARLAPGQVVRGTVRRLATFGAFVDIGGVDGLVHISDLAWHRVKTPSEVVSVGDEVEVAVLKADRQTRKISLSLKAVQRDPWFDKVENLAEGAILQGTVTKISSFGAFVEIAKGIEGLVHISEVDDRRVAHVEDAVAVGQQVPVKILGIDKQNKRISLSIAQAKQEKDRAEYQPYLETESKGLGVTIGDKLGHLFKRED